jgi:hypothetical protein
LSYEDIEKVLLCPEIAKVSSFEQKRKNNWVNFKA